LIGWEKLLFKRCLRNELMDGWRVVNWRLEKFLLKQFHIIGTFDIYEYTGVRKLGLRENILMVISI
jgi:hypothetical protein